MVNQEELRIDPSKGNELFVKACNEPGGLEKYWHRLDEELEENWLPLLCWAAANKGPAVLKQIAAKCPDVSAPARNKNALCLAVTNGHVDAVHALLELGTDVNARTVDGFTALHLSVSAGLADIIGVLLLARADVQALTPDRKNALHIALQEGNDDSLTRIALELLEHDIDVNAADSGGRTPLTSAIHHGNVIVARQLFVHGARPPADPVMRAELTAHCQANKRNDLLRLMRSHRWESPTDDAFIADYNNVNGNHSTASTVTDTLAKLSTGDLVDGAVTFPSGSDCGLSLHQSVGNEPLSGVERALAEAHGAVSASPVDSAGRTPLHVAAEAGEADVIESLLRANADVNVQDSKGCTPLYLAVSQGNLAAVRALLFVGKADVEIPDRANRYRPLFVAMVKGHHEVMETLLEAGASPGTSGEKGETPLLGAIRMNTPGAVAALLRAGALPGHCWNEKLQTPLHWAANYGRVEAAKQLIPLLSSRQINMRDKVMSAHEGGQTALLIAVRRGDANMVDTLLEGGADPTIRSGCSDGYSLLQCAALHDPTGSMATTKNNDKSCDDDSEQQPQEGRLSARPRIIHALVEAGADVDEIGPNGLTALHMAALDGAPGDVLRALLDCGADCLAPCASLEFLSSLHLAAYGGGVEALKFLLEFPACGGVDQEGPSPARHTPLSVAIVMGHVDAVRLLLEEGADLDKVPFGEDGTTPLVPSLVHLAAAHGNGEAITLLLQAIRLRKEAGERGFQWR